MNLIVLLGRLTADPELKKTPTDISVCSFTVAVERRSKDKETNKYLVDYIDCTAWRSDAEFISKYFSKGDMIAVSGRLEIRTYKDKQDKTQKKAEVVIDTVSFAGRKEKKSDQGESGGGLAFQNGEFEDVGDGGDLPL